MVKKWPKSVYVNIECPLTYVGSPAGPEAPEVPGPFLDIASNFGNRLIQKVWHLNISVPKLSLKFWHPTHPNTAATFYRGLALAGQRSSIVNR